MAVVAMSITIGRRPRRARRPAIGFVPSILSTPPYGGTHCRGGGEHDAKARVPGQCFSREPEAAVEADVTDAGLPQHQLMSHFRSQAARHEPSTGWPAQPFPSIAPSDENF